MKGYGSSSNGSNGGYSNKVQGGTMSAPMPESGSKMKKMTPGAPRTCPEFTPPTSKMPTRMR
jgi:hypothetical protein